LWTKEKVVITLFTKLISKVITSFTLSDFGIKVPVIYSKYAEQTAIIDNKCLEGKFF
jgi:hypothetical protein